MLQLAISSDRRAALRLKPGVTFAPPLPALARQVLGARGGVAHPGPGRAGDVGNAPCIEVRSAGGTLVVIDCGTGIHSLGQKLLSSGAKSVRGYILISHTHWDHIQGFPFFAPLFVRGNESTFNPAGNRHRLSNRESEPLVIIEVQTGAYVEEDDIVRLEDVYGRS